MLPIHIRRKLAGTLLGRVIFVISPCFLFTTIQFSIDIIREAIGDPDFLHFFNSKKFPFYRSLTDLLGITDESYYFLLMPVSMFVFSIYIFGVGHAIGFIVRIERVKFFSEEFILNEYEKHNSSIKSTTTLLERSLVFAPGLIIATIELLIDTISGYNMDRMYFLTVVLFIGRVFFIVHIMSFIHMIGFIFRLKIFKLFSEEFPSLIKSYFNPRLLK